MASRLALLGELRASRGARDAARPSTLAFSGETCVVGYEDGAVVAWRAIDVVSRSRARAASDVTDTPASPVWVVVSLNGSGGDRCPIDALCVLPACVAHPAGAVAVAHGGVQVDVTGVGGYDPRPARVSILCLDTGHETRVLTLPMAWPDGGICPVARMLPTDEEGGLVAVSAARMYRTGEGALGFQGSNATLSIWSGASPVPIAVAQAGPHHAPALGPDPGELRRLNPGAPAPPGGVRKRLPLTPILAPFAGLTVTRTAEESESGSENVVIKAAHVCVISAGSVGNSGNSGGNSSKLHVCVHEWHLARPGFPQGTPLRAKRLVERASFEMGGDAALQSFANGNAGSADPSLPEVTGGMPCVTGWESWLAAVWKGSSPCAGVWRFGTQGSAADCYEKQQSASAALERCVAGARCVSLVPGPCQGRLFALVHDTKSLPISSSGATTKLFVTLAGEATGVSEDVERVSVERTSTGDDESNGKTKETVFPSFPDEKTNQSQSEDEDDSCPICLEVPGAGGVDSKLYTYDLKTNPFANSERKKNVVRAKCCGAPFCVSCLREYLQNFRASSGKPYENACPSCREISLFNATVIDGGAGSITSLKKHKENTAPWREISLDFQNLARAFRGGNERANANDEADADADASVDQSTAGDLADDFLRLPSRQGSVALSAAAASSSEAAYAQLVSEPDPHAMSMADGAARASIVGTAGLSHDFFRVDRWGADLPPEGISPDFLRGMAPSDLVVSPAIGGPVTEWGFGGPARFARDVRDGNVDEPNTFVPNLPSFIGHAYGPSGQDATLVRMDRESMVMCEKTGVLAVLTRRGVALLDASEARLQGLFRESE